MSTGKQLQQRAVLGPGPFTSQEVSVSFYSSGRNSVKRRVRALGQKGTKHFNAGREGKAPRPMLLCFVRPRIYPVWLYTTVHVGFIWNSTKLRVFFE